MSKSVLVTVTDTGEDVVELPDESVATAVMVWLPLETVLEFQEIEYGLVVAWPTLLPSTLN
jgi:hypothetical protein